MPSNFIAFIIDHNGGHSCQMYSVRVTSKRHRETHHLMHKWIGNKKAHFHINDILSVER